MERYLATQNPVRQQDVQALIGIVAVLEGLVMGGAVGEELVERFAGTLVNAGLLEAGEGVTPSAGRVHVAMANLIDRLRYALGEYETEPEPDPDLAAHALLFIDEGAAAACREELLARGAEAVHLEVDEGRGWVLLAVYPELPPDPGFHARAREMGEVALRFGGRYSGSQGAPR